MPDLFEENLDVNYSSTKRSMGKYKLLASSVSAQISLCKNICQPNKNLYLIWCQWTY